MEELKTTEAVGEESSRSAVRPNDSGERAPGREGSYRCCTRPAAGSNSSAKLRMAEEGGGSGALDERLLAEHQSRELGLRVLSQRQELSRAHAELQHLRDHRRSTEDALASTARCVLPSDPPARVSPAELT